MSGRKSCELHESAAGLHVSSSSLQVCKRGEQFVRKLSSLRSQRREACSLFAADSSSPDACRGVARADLQVGPRAMWFAKDVHSLYANAGDASL